jgi:hypothetical protein
MKFRYQAFDENAQLCRGFIAARDADEARSMLGERFSCVAQLSRVRGLGALNPPREPGTFTLAASEQFIPERPPRRVSVRGPSGVEDRRLVGHVEMLGAKDVTQFWLCLILYVSAALMMWLAFPPVHDVELREWVEPRRNPPEDMPDSPFFVALLLVVSNSLVTLLALAVTLALKHSLTRVGLTVLAVYVAQWFACSGLLEEPDGPGSAIRFLAGYPAYTFFAWIVPVAVMIGAERLSRRLLEMTVPVLENPETGELELGRGELRIL